MRKVIFLFVIVAVVGAAIGKEPEESMDSDDSWSEAEECADNAEYVSCVKNSATCSDSPPETDEESDPNSAILPDSEESSCEEGCQCKDGYVMPSYGSDYCVTIEECSKLPECGRNEVVERCEGLECPSGWRCRCRGGYRSVYPEGGRRRCIRIPHSRSKCKKHKH